MRREKKVESSTLCFVKQNISSYVSFQLSKRHSAVRRTYRPIREEYWLGLTNEKPAQWDAGHRQAGGSGQFRFMFELDNVRIHSRNYRLTFNYSNDNLKDFKIEHHFASVIALWAKGRNLWI